jgi:hypothetical protein
MGSLTDMAASTLDVKFFGCSGMSAFMSTRFGAIGG